MLLVFRSPLPCFALSYPSHHASNRSLWRVIGMSVSSFIGVFINTLLLLLILRHTFHHLPFDYSHQSTRSRISIRTSLFMLTASAIKCPVDQPRVIHSTPDRRYILSVSKAGHSLPAANIIRYRRVDQWLVTYAAIWARRWVSVVRL